MKKLIYFIGLCLITVILFSYGKSNKNLENMKTQENNDYISITWEDRNYVPFCVVNNSERGAKIGIVNGDKDYQVYEYRGHSTDNWIISFYKSGEMDNSVLMKEINVVEIPDNLQPDYEWNNK